MTRHLCFPVTLLLVYGIYHFLYICTWWRHQMETFSALLAICEGNSPVPSDCSAQRPATRRLVSRYRAHYDVFVMKWQWFDLFKTRSSLLKLQGSFCPMASNIPAADDDRNNRKCTWPSQLPCDYGLPITGDCGTWSPFVITRNDVRLCLVWLLW